nr:hypothetical protein [Tanacetum cinerariifolium]
MDILYKNQKERERTHQPRREEGFGSTTNIFLLPLEARLTLVLRPCSNTRVEISTITQIPDLAGDIKNFLKNGKLDQVVAIVKSCTLNVLVDLTVTLKDLLGDIKNFLKNGKLDQVVAILKSCTLNVLVDLTVTLKDLLGTINGSIHHNVIDEMGYEKDITVGVALILANVLVFSPKPSMYYFNITIRNVVKVGGNVNDKEHQYKLDEKALNITLEEEAKAARLNKSG